MNAVDGSRAARVIHRAAWALAVALAAFALIGGADGAFRGDLGVPATQQRNDTDSSKHLTHVTLATVRTTNVVSSGRQQLVGAAGHVTGLVLSPSSLVGIIGAALLITIGRHRQRPGAGRAPPAVIA